MIHHGGKINCLGCCMHRVEWLKSLINNIPLLHKLVLSISLYCDSQEAIARVKTKNYSEKRRHLTMRHKSMGHALSHGVISIEFLRLKNNIADLHTNRSSEAWRSYEQSSMGRNELVCTVDLEKYRLYYF